MFLVPWWLIPNRRSRPETTLKTSIPSRRLRKPGRLPSSSRMAIPCRRGGALNRVSEFPARGGFVCRWEECIPCCGRDRWSFEGDEAVPERATNIFRTDHDANPRADGDVGCDPALGNAFIHTHLSFFAVQTQEQAGKEVGFAYERGDKQVDGTFVERVSTWTTWPLRITATRSESVSASS